MVSSHLVIGSAAIRALFRDPAHYVLEQLRLTFFLIDSVWEHVRRYEGSIAHVRRVTVELSIMSVVMHALFRDPFHYVCEQLRLAFLFACNVAASFDPT